MKGELGFFIGDASVMAATTVGAGIFSLPYIFAQAGWFIGIFYLAVMAAVVIFVHSLFWKTLAASEGRSGLLGLGKFYLGKTGFAIGFVSIVGGLVLTLVIYLILGSRFINILWPSLGERPGFFLFWIIVSLPLFLKERRFSILETLGIVLMIVAVFFIFFSFWHDSVLFKIPAVNVENLFLPFGAILFALAGWTAVEPIYRTRRESGSVSRPLSGLAAGTIVAAILYFMFTIGIFGSAASITADTLSGLTGWPAWRLLMLALFALFAIWTSYFPIGDEIKNSIERDMGLGRILSLGVVILLPIILVNLGLSSFIKIIALAGGVFLSVQYLLIILVARKSLIFGRIGKFLLNFLVLIFVIAAVYELYYFLK